ncbi:GNAT family N-acetyltransferase [Streptomyces polygonati]|uniref:GNAT family N-acetyltransferase n=1 Tax=Streptomyces polygonati TaxID=1617087 RepID=A0ABV8HI29_9ACTN
MDRPVNAVIPPALAEQSEAEALHDLETSAPQHVRAALGMEAVRLGGGVVLSMRDDPTRFWSKALGFGFDEPVTLELMEEVCGFYRKQGTPLAVVQLAPSVLPEDWAEICARTGLTAGSAWVKLACATRDALARADAPGRPADGLRAAPVTAAHAATWGSVMLRAFGMPADGGLADMVVSSVGGPDWRPFAAWDGEELVGTGTLRVKGDAGQFVAGATLPHARGRGGQSALLAARARAADEAGCRWLVAETGAEEPGTHNSSLHNMLRLGFEVQYERRNWIWRADE